MVFRSVGRCVACADTRIELWRNESLGGLRVGMDVGSLGRRCLFGMELMGLEIEA